MPLLTRIVRQRRRQNAGETYQPPTMTSMTFGQKKFIPTAPEKGSFPLDHGGQCRKLMLFYMRCLRENADDNSACRQESKAYLQCRMDNELMAREDFAKLGYGESEPKTEQS
ncbi:hypothetical protein ZHAS_00013003 [Anopheles sinensis]|uniref:CHCH domain-containing protein n=1 Tax=Anopheles sinensis TaxID=74873 RepID=A0A084W4E1_ANOSI|nr:hypothetical protein ZHAS_00013003 [Anopheles sinensis]